MSEKPEYHNRIADISSTDRPREKAIAHGSMESLTDTEILAIVLGSGIPGKSVIELADEVLRECNRDIHRLYGLSIREMIRKFKGVGPAKAVSLAAAVELAKRLKSRPREEVKKIKQSADAYDLLKTDMGNLDHEEFRMIILSRAGVVKSVEVISRGGTAATVVDLKLLLKKAIDSLASGVIVAHNHPSDNLAPSIEDDRLTHRIDEGCKAVDIQLLDHLIITSTGFYSYKDQGRL